MPSFQQRLRELVSPWNRRTSVGVGLVLAVALLLFLSLRTGEPDPVGGPPMLRRLTEEQYRNAIADIFSPEIEIPGRFERPLRTHGLIAIGTGNAGISPFAVEQYDASAQAIAAAVLGPKQRSKFLDCQPKTANSFDEQCARKFLGANGRSLFRRPLAEGELNHFSDIAREGTRQLGNFNKGLELGLYAMLVAPDFLFRIERYGLGGDGSVRELDPFSRAERLSFFLTNSTPDVELLDAAANGELDSAWGVSRQVDRLMQSGRFEGAVRSFFADMLEFDRFGELSKDPEIYPAFSSDLAKDAQEQTLRTITEHLLGHSGDYRDLFTLRDTYLTRNLGVIYRTPVSSRDDWSAVTFSPGAGREGIQSHISFLALHAHPGRSSPTLRGYALRQVFLCQEVPDPPANVNFTEIEKHVGSKNVTARDRLKIHSTEPSCAGCHKVMDPPGLTLERFDGVGASRTFENGERIDLSGDLDGTAFDSLDGLANALRNHPETPRCVAQRLYNSAVGRDIGWKERYYLDWLIDKFSDDDFNVPALMRRIATSDNFFAVTAPTSRPKSNFANGTDAQGDKS